jgi:hypothetical protein
MFTFIIESEDNLKIDEIKNLFKNSLIYSYFYLNYHKEIVIETNMEINEIKSVLNGINCKIIDLNNF